MVPVRCAPCAPCPCVSIDVGVILLYICDDESAQEGSVTTTKPHPSERVRRQARLSARITDETKREAERAAHYAQVSFTAFVEQAIREKAQAVIHAHERLDVNAAASRAMIAAWLDPAPLPPALTDALARHDTLVQSEP